MTERSLAGGREAEPRGEEGWAGRAERRACVSTAGPLPCALPKAPSPGLSALMAEA